MLSFRPFVGSFAEAGGAFRTDATDSRGSALSVVRPVSDPVEERAVGPLLVRAGVNPLLDLPGRVSNGLSWQRDTVLHAAHPDLWASRAGQYW